MTDTDPDIPNRGYKQRIIRCKDDPGSEIPCNNHRAEFRDSYNTTTPGLLPPPLLRQQQLYRV